MVISTDEEVEIDGSRGTANFVFKWPDTKKQARSRGTDQGNGPGARTRSGCLRVQRSHPCAHDSACWHGEPGAALPRHPGANALKPACGRRPSSSRRSRS